MSRVLPDHSRVEYRDCYFTRLSIDPETHQGRLPRFRGCFFSEVEGRVSVRDLPPDVFDENCDFDGFTDAVSSTNSILDLGIPLEVRPESLDKHRVMC